MEQAETGFEFARFIAESRRWLAEMQAGTNKTSMLLARSKEAIFESRDILGALMDGEQAGGNR